MKSFRYKFVVLLFTFSTLQVKAFSAGSSLGGIKTYSLDQLITSGRDWEKFCLDEKRKLSQFRYKFRGFESAGTFSENEKVHSEMLQIGSLQIPVIRLFENMEISSEVYEEDGFFIEAKAKSIYLTISRTPLQINKNFWGGVVDKRKEEKGHEVSSVLFPSGFSIVSQIREQLLTTPDNLSCTEKFELDDKRALLFLGIKGESDVKFYDLIEIGHFGYLEVRESGKSISVSIVYEKDGSMYEIFLSLNMNDANSALKEQIISRLKYGENLGFESVSDEYGYLVNRLDSLP